MADKKISALTAASTPLAGTEVLPIVQSGATVKVSAANITAGRAMSALSGSFGTGTSAFSISGTQVSATNTSANAYLSVYAGSGASTQGGFLLGANNTENQANILWVNSGNYLQLAANPASSKIKLIAAGVDVGDITTSGYTPTAGKGIDFSANTHAAGMTSELLNWYEEGTWTPVLSDGTNNATMATAAAAYTRIGNLVTVWAWIETSSLGSVTGNISITGLPFTVKNDNAAYGSAGVVANAYNLNITAGQMVTVRANPNATTLNVYLWDATTGSTNMQASEWSADGGAQFSCTYRAA